MTKKTSQKKRTGTLYRRLKGRDYSIDDPVAAEGTIWLQYRLNGITTRYSLKTTDLKTAEAERERKMYPLRLADEAEASAQLALRAEQAKLEHEAAVAAPPLRVDQAWDTYLASPERPDSGKATLRNYSFQWDRFRKWHEKNHSGAPYMKDVSRKIASAYASDLKAANLAPSTYNKHIAFLRLVFRILHEDSGLEENPFGWITKMAMEPSSRRELSQDELTKVLEEATGEMKTLFYIGTFTGMRLGDCATLKWSEVDMKNLLVKRVPNKLRRRKKRKPVVIGIPDALFQHLNEIPASKRKGHVLSAIAGEYQNDAPGLTDKIQKHFESCGIQTHQDGTGYIKAPDPSGKHEYIWEYTGKRAVVEVGFHSLRHTFVSLHATLGTPQAVVQAIVGHGNPAVTDHYTHIGPESAKLAATVLDAGIQGLGKKKKKTKKAPIPPWAIEDLKKQTSENWESIRDELIDQ